MACGLALKRPHNREYETFLADDGYGSEAKRARTSVQCSPFRPQMGTIAASLPSTSTFAKRVKVEENSPFALVSGRVQLSSSQLDAYLNSECKTLGRRKLLPKTTSEASGDAAASTNENGKRGYRAPKSPTQSGSDSEGEGGCQRTTLYTRPQFNLKHVKMICERLLREQELRLRHEYEVVLNQKLEEQHEQYVQFAKEQLSKQRDDTTENDYSYSYLS